LNNPIIIPELVAPAGDFEKLSAAVRFGADAVYFAATSFGMRAAAGNFAPETLADTVRYCHDRSVKAYITVNTYPRQRELAALPDLLRIIAEAAPDAVIAADIGVLAMCKRYIPDIPIHISTQANVCNAEAANMWHSLGASRVILAREMHIGDIAALRDNTHPGLGIECFAHGSMCMAVSGRCHISEYLTGRSANNGACAQPCRWEWNMHETIRGDGEVFTAQTDETGLYLFNSKDLYTIDYIDKMAAAGISALKIEGRQRTAYYAAVITNAYRLAIDGYAANPVHWRCPPELRAEVDTVSHRLYSTGFYFGETHIEEIKSSGYIRTREVVGVVGATDERGLVEITQKNRFDCGETLELLSPGRLPFPVMITELYDADGAAISGTNRPHARVWAKLDAAADEGDMLRRAIIQ